jgi:periplasmic protein TonB
MSAPPAPASLAAPAAALAPAPSPAGAEGAGTRAAVLGLVLGLHALVLAEVLVRPPVQAQTVAPPMMVSLLAPPQAEEGAPLPPAPPTPSKAVRPITTAPRPQPQPPAAQPLPKTGITAPAPSDPVPAASSAAPAAALAPPSESVAGGSVSSAPISPARYDAAYLNNQTPYPPMARRLGESGTVQLRVLISAEGLAEKVELLASSGSPRLDEGAQAAVRRWRFIPARQGDQAIASFHIIPIVYTLKEP